MDSRWFFRDLLPLPSFDEAANAANHTSLPDDWFIVSCDIVGSTKAIEDGKYKNVNTIGAAAIVAVMNVDKSIEIPFVFGGDGATLAVPKCMEAGTRSALLAAQNLARDGFNLDLRIGMIPVADAKKSGDRVNVGKYFLNGKVFQTSLSGFGWDAAERLIKDPNTRTLYEVIATPEIQPHADFTGFECKWQPVPARSSHKLAILVQSLSKEPADHLQVYLDVLRELRSIYGDSIDGHPLNSKQLKLTYNPVALLGEFLVRTNGLSFKGRSQYFFKLIFNMLAGHLVIGYGLKFLGIDWNKYKEEVVQNSDFRKFDGMLKMVVDGSDEQRTKLETYLQKKYLDRVLVFGTHSSKAAIITCIVFSYSDNHSHFVDGSDGGYTMAAKDLKRKMHEFKLENQEPRTA